ncbi:hypothetical protein AB0J51_22700 [Micromonospora echinofusca]|uniref:hypothetical protein n=1 Tax=Micromonospora echinofusca TaxID=47858 RepID=UPI0034405338
MPRWWRIDPWGVRQAFLGLLLAAGATIAAVVLVSVLKAADAGRVDAREGLGAVAVAAFLALWLTLGTRFYLVGVYVNDRGVRLRYNFSTRTLPWSEVTGFDVRPAVLLGEPTVRDACWVRTAEGPVETPVQRRSREMGWRKDVGPVLSPKEFDRLVARLDAELAAARRAQAGGGAVPR